MAEILLINPRKRKKARRKKTVARKKRRSAAQKRATAKMIAANRRRGRGKNPVARKRKRRRKPTRGKSAVARSRRRKAPVRRRRRTGNPKRITARGIQNQLMDAGTGAVGALGLDVIQGYLPIPAQWKGGLVGTGVKALLAIGMGVVASNVKIIRGTTANKMVNGALTVVLHDELRKQVSTFAPGLQLGEYMGENGLGYYGSGYPAGIMDENYGGMGSYLPELSTDDLGMEQWGLNEYMGGGENDYIEDMAYT